MPTPKKRNSKGKRHVVHSESLFNISDKLSEHAANDQVQLHDPRSLLRVISDVIKSEAKRVQSILR